MQEKTVTVTWNADLTQEERCLVVKQAFGLSESIYRTGSTHDLWLSVDGECKATLPVTLREYEVEAMMRILRELELLDPDVDIHVEKVYQEEAPVLKTPGIMWPYDTCNFDARKLTVTHTADEDDFEEFDNQMREAVKALRQTLRAKVALGEIESAEISSDCRKIDIIREERACDPGLGEE